MNNLGDNYNLSAQSEFLLFTDIFENFRDTCLKNTYNKRKTLKTKKVKLESLTDMDILLMVYTLLLLLSFST